MITNFSGAFNQVLNAMVVRQTKDNAEGLKNEVDKRVINEASTSKTLPSSPDDPTLRNENYLKDDPMLLKTIMATSKSMKRLNLERAVIQANKNLTRINAQRRESTYNDHNFDEPDIIGQAQARAKEVA